MTDFKVTDEAVETACVAHYSAWPKFHQHERETFRKEMRAAIEATLPVMFEPVGFLVGFSFFFDPTNARRRAEGTGMPVMDIYRIKEPK